MALLLTCATVVAYAPRAVTGDERERSRVEEWSVPREGAAALRLQNPGGNLRFLASTDDRIRVVAEKKVQGGDARAAEAFLEQMTLSRRRDGERWLFEASWPRPDRGWQQSAHVNWEVRLPRGMRLEAETGGGNVSAEEIASARLRTGGGNMAAKRIAGPTDLHTGGGNVALRETGEARIHTGGGNVEVTGAHGSVNLETGGGNVSVDGCDGALVAQTGGGNMEVRGVRGSLTGRTGGGNIRAGLGPSDGPAKAELRTGAGDIDLTLNGRADAEVRAETGNGRVTLEPARIARLSSDETRLEARLGTGRGRVQLHTGSGSIRVRVAERQAP
jgi:hypothetical protein